MSNDNKNEVIIYSTTWCGFCKMAKQYLDSKSVPYVEKDIEADEDARQELLGKMNGNFQGVPVLDVNHQVILGFDRPKIDAALVAA